MLDQAAALELYRKLGREFGLKGGRPRTIIHDPYSKDCRCVECRQTKAERAKKRSKKP